MKILAFGASNSAQSINQKLARYAATLVTDAEVEMLDLNDYEMPIFSIEREAALGQHELAIQFRQKIADADALVISFAEHNGSYSVAFKNVFDWASRIDRDIYGGKPAVFLSTSPGSRGGAGVLATAVNAAPHFGAEIVASLSVPSFQSSFDQESMTPVSQEIAQSIANIMLKLQHRLGS